jgi:hypothetical protein
MKTTSTTRPVLGLVLILISWSSGAADRPARAVAYSWMGPGNVWSAAGNWNPNTGPPLNPGDSAMINMSGGSGNVLDVNASIDSLSMNSAAASLAMQSGKTLTVSGPIMLTQGRVFMTKATFAGAGTLTITTKSSLSAVGASSIQNPISLSGTLTVTDSKDTPELTKLSLTKDLTNGGTIQMTGSQDIGLILEVNGGKGTLTNNGMMTFGGTNGTFSTVSASVLNTATGKITVNFNGANSPTTFGADGAKGKNLGSISISDGARLFLTGASFTNDKDATGTGKITGTGTLDRSAIPKGGWTNNGTVKVGNEVVAAGGPGSLIPGMLAFVGDYVQSATGEVDFEIARSGVAGTDYSLLAISQGAGLLDGLLSVTVDDPSMILPGSTFTILTADGGITGSFANAPEDSNGMSTLLTNAGTFTVIYGSNFVELTNFVQAVPEPTSVALVLAGGGVALAWSRVAGRRRSVEG